MIHFHYEKKLKIEEINLFSFSGTYGGIEQNTWYLFFGFSSERILTSNSIITYEFIQFYVNM